MHEPFAMTAVDRGHLLSLAGRLDVQAVDATGLGVLLGAHRRAGRAGRTLVLRDVQPSVGRILHVTRLDRVLHQDRVA